MVSSLKNALPLSAPEALGREENWDSWIWMSNIDLIQPTRDAPVGTFCRSVEAAAALAARMAEEAKPAQRALGALKVRRKLEKKPIARDSQLYSKGKDFEQRRDGTSQLSIIHNDLYVWVGVDPKEPSVYYGHGFDDAQFPALSKRLAERLGVQLSARAGYPGAVLFDAISLRKTDAADISARGEEVFRAFVKLTSAKRQQDEMDLTEARCGQR